MNKEKIIQWDDFKNKEKNDSTNKDEFVNCRCCDEYIQGDSRSSSDKRYCSDCAQHCDNMDNGGIPAIMLRYVN